MSRRPPTDPDAAGDAGATERDGDESEDESGADTVARTDGTTTTSAPDTTVGLLRWGVDRLGTAPVLAVPFVLVAVAITAAEAGITPVATEFGTVPRVAPWVWPVQVGAFLGWWIGLGAVLLYAGDARLGVERPHSRRLLVAARALPRMLAVAVIGGIPVVAGLFAFLVPGIYFAVKFALALPACVIDDLGPAASLRRSFVTTGERLSTIAGLLASFVAVMVLTAVVVTVVGRSVGTEFAGPLLQNLATAAVVPVYALAVGRLYPVSRDAPA